jgi:hypothetical protein
MELREEIEVLLHEKEILDQEKNFKKALQGIKPEVDRKMDALRNENLFLSKENSKLKQVRFCFFRKLFIKL